MQQKLKCIVCHTEMENIMVGRGVQPNGGLEFTTHGHYGSAVFDPMDSTFLSISVCDPCLKHAGECGFVNKGQNAQPNPFKYELWNISEEE